MLNSALIGQYKMSVTEEWDIYCHVGCVYKIGVGIPFSQTVQVCQIICMCMFIIMRLICQYIYIH